MQSQIVELSLSGLGWKPVNPIVRTRENSPPAPVGGYGTGLTGQDPNELLSFYTLECKVDLGCPVIASRDLSDVAQNELVRFAPKGTIAQYLVRDSEFENYLLAPDPNDPEKRARVLPIRTEKVPNGWNGYGGMGLPTPQIR